MYTIKQPKCGRCDTALAPVWRRPQVWRCTKCHTEEIVEISN